MASLAVYVQRVQPPKEVLASKHVVRSKQKGPFTSTDGKLRKFTRGAEVNLEFLVEEHAEGISNGEELVDRRGADAVLACVFHSLPTEGLSAGFAEGRMGERGLISWIREQSCKDLNRNRGGSGRTPHAVRNCSGGGGGRRGPPAARRKKGFGCEPRRQARGPRFGPQGCPSLLRDAELFYKPAASKHFGNANAAVDNATQQEQ
jgi:hypothetical protein